MHTMIRIMLVLAALAYGAMPLTGMAGPMVMTDPVQASIAYASIAQADDTGPMGHAGHEAPNQQVHHESAPDGDCPHPGKTMPSGHCAACLTLAADVVIACFGKPARSALSPRAITPLTSRAAAPLDPPPRV